MTRRSLRLRLALAGAASCGLALVFAFLGLSLLFERHVERRIVDELTVHLEQVIAGLGPAGEGGLDVARPPADPRFQVPLSGLYWQIDARGLQRFSRSLWDRAMDIPDLRETGLRQTYLRSPSGAELVAVVRDIVTEPRLGGIALRATVAADRSIIREATAAYRRDMIPYLGLLGVLLIAATIAQIFIGLQPLSDLRQRIAAIRSGQAERLGDEFPDEVLPLTIEVDGLLQSREDQLRRARERAAELAHGFKTPLQVLAGDIARLKEAGQTGIATDLATVIAAMHRLVDHEMARARIAVTGHRASADLASVVSSVIAVVRRTPAGQRIAWDIDLEDGLIVRLDTDDLTELIGNVTENAARYGRETVSIRATTKNDLIVIEVVDDGPGILEDQLPYVLRRGGRLDTTSGGAGLGLAISESIVQAAGGTIGLENVNPGLKVVLGLPIALAAATATTTRRS